MKKRNPIPLLNMWGKKSKKRYKEKEEKKIAFTEGNVMIRLLP